MTNTRCSPNRTTDKQAMRSFTRLSHATRLGLNVERFFQRMRARHGNTFTVLMPGLNDVVFTSEPALVSQLLQADSDTLSSSLPSPLQPLLGNGSLILLQGRAHTQERQQLRPLFQGACLHRYSGFIRQAISDACHPLSSPVDAQAFMKKVTLDVILRAVFGIDTPDRRALFSAAIERLLNAFTSLLLLVPQARFSLFGISPWDRFLQARQTLDDLIFAEIRQRAPGREADDILSHLLRQHASQSPLTEADLPHIRDQLTTLLLAGHETTANSLAWALYYLATHQQAQTSIRQQLGEQAAAPQETQNSAAMKSERLDAFCKEVLRLRPVVPLVIRSVLQPFTLGQHPLRPGTYVGVATHNLHTDPDLYSHPFQFDPERFLRRKYKANEFVPFGGGDKKCLGYGFALHEMKLILAHLLERYTIHLHQAVLPESSIQGLTMGPRQRILISLKAPLQATGIRS